MFGFARKRATRHAVEALRPLIGIAQHFHGIPAGFWQDQFVLGYIGFMAGFHAKSSGIKLSHEDMGLMLFDVFEALSNQNGRAIGQKYIDLCLINPSPPAFKKGLDNAAICAFVSVGKVPDFGQEAYEAARSIAKAQNAENDLTAVVGALVHKLWFAELRERFRHGEG